MSRRNFTQASTFQAWRTRRVCVGGTNNLNLPKIIANLVEGESSGLDFGTLPSWQCGHLLTDTSRWKMAGVGRNTG